jgi:hypothetical protein
MIINCGASISNNLSKRSLKDSGFSPVNFSKSSVYDEASSSTPLAFIFSKAAEETGWGDALVDVLEMVFKNS